MQFFIKPTFSKDELKILCTDRDTISHEFTDHLWDEFISTNEKNGPLIKNSKTDNYLTKLGKIGNQILNSSFAMDNREQLEKTWKIFNFDKKKILAKVGTFTSFDSVQLSNWQSFMKSLPICMAYEYKDLDEVEVLGQNHSVDKLFPGLKELFSKDDSQVINKKNSESKETEKPFDNLDIIVKKKPLKKTLNLSKVLNDSFFETNIPINLSFQEKLSLVRDLPQSLPPCKDDQDKFLCSAVEINNYGDKSVYFWNKDNELYDYFYFAYDNGKSFNQFHKLVDTSYQSINYVLNNSDINKTIETIEIIGNEIIGQGRYTYDSDINNFRKIGVWIYEAKDGTFFKVILDDKGVLNESLTLN